MDTASAIPAGQETASNVVDVAHRAVVDNRSCIKNGVEFSLVQFRPTTVTRVLAKSVRVKYCPAGPYFT